MDHQAFQHQMKLVKDRLSTMPSRYTPSSFIVDNVCEQLRELRTSLDTLQACCQTYTTRAAPVTPYNPYYLHVAGPFQPPNLHLRTGTLEEKVFHLEQRLTRLESPILTPSTTASFEDVDPLGSSTLSLTNQQCSDRDIACSSDKIAQLSDEIAQKDSEIHHLQDKLSDSNRIISDLQKRLKEHGLPSNETFNPKQSEVLRDGVAIPLSLVSGVAQAPGPAPKKRIPCKPIAFGCPSDQTYLELSTPTRLKGQQLPIEAMRASLWSNQPGPPRLHKFGEASPLGNSWRKITSI